MALRFNESKSLLVVFLVVSIILPVSFTSPILASDPIIHHVTSCAQLEALGQNPSSRGDTILLDNDIDCVGRNFKPMYDYDNPFTGTFDGQGHKVNRLNITNNLISAGLLSATDGATIRNVTLVSGSIQGVEGGGLIGYAINTNITNVVSRLDVTVSNYNGGGLVGTLHNTSENQTYTISNSSATGNVIGDGSNVGGLVGQLISDGASVVVKQSFATGNVTANGYVGGLIGSVWAEGISADLYITVIDSYAAGNVSGTFITGGLIGYWRYQNEQVTPAQHLSRTYASGSVSGGSRVGGLVGGLHQISAVPLDFSHNFSAGPVSSGTNLGAFVGSINGTDTESLDNYYALSGSGAANCNHGTLLENCTPVDTVTHPSYFKGNSSSAPLNSWDFDHIWQVNTNGYPTLRPFEDGDNTATTVERNAPNDGDANQDHITDDLQVNVSSLKNPVTGKYNTLALPDVCSITAATISSESSNAKADFGFDYPAGLLNFSADCGTPGITVTATLYLYGLSAKDLVARKYNSVNQSYGAVPDASIIETTIGNEAVTIVTYDITDGSSMDEDEEENGIIIDPIGLGLNTIGTPNTGVNSVQDLLFVKYRQT